MKHKKSLMGIVGVLGTGAIFSVVRYLTKKSNEENIEENDKKLEYLKILNRNLKDKQYRVCSKDNLPNIKDEDVDLCRVLTEVWQDRGLLTENEVVTMWYSDKE